MKITAGLALTLPAALPLALAAAPARALVVTSNPNAAITNAYTGVGRVTAFRDSANANGTGTLLWTGRHVLTAAHLFTPDFSALNDTNSVTLRFNLPTGGIATIAARSWTIHPDWNGNAGRGHDIAIIELADLAPTSLTRYDIARTADELGQTFTKVGYGRSGTGTTGSTLNGGTKRAGQNRYDTTSTAANLALSTIPNSILIYDFDNGLAANDALGTIRNLNDLGLGAAEAIAAPGDSGGPSFNALNQIIGVTSYIARVSSLPGGSLPDADTVINSTFGELGGDTRVSAYADWITTIVPVPAPGVVALAAPAVLLASRRRRN